MLKTFREAEIVVISDLHLGTHACKATELNHYLKNIRTKTLVLNGDIIDAWRFSRNYFPKSHFKVIRQIIKMLEKGTEVFYVTGNHDEFLRKLENATIGKLKIVNQLLLDLDGQKTWIFHGDILDPVIHKTKWLAKTGAALYGFVTITNKIINLFLKSLIHKPIILYKAMNSRSSKSEQKFNKFEEALARMATERDVDVVICGHTHKPKDKILKYKQKEVRYINTGDWVENFTASEYRNGNWNLFSFAEVAESDSEMDDVPDYKELYSQIFSQLALS